MRHTLHGKGGNTVAYVFIPCVHLRLLRVIQVKISVLILCETLEIISISHCTLQTLVCFLKLRFNDRYLGVLLKDHERFDPKGHLWKSELNQG